METHELSKTCKNCATTHILILSKREAAFDNIWSQILKEAKCPECGETDYSSSKLLLLEIDDELMEMWIKDENLLFMEQDEDLILADNDIELILRFIDREDILPSKLNILFSVLCGIIFDAENASDPKAKRATEALLERKGILMENKNHIWDYIGEKVFPKLGLKWD